MHCLREEFRAAKGQVYVENESLSKLTLAYFREIKPELVEEKAEYSGGLQFW